MKREYIYAAFGVFGLASLGFNGIQHLSAQTPPATKGEAKGPASGAKTLVQADISGVEGKEIIVVQIDSPPGAGQPLHTHPGDEIAIVLDGELTRIVDGEQPHVVKAGETYRNPQGLKHTSSNRGTVPARSIAIFIVDKGKPRLVPVQ